jgi:hypothetical protein
MRSFVQDSQGRFVALESIELVHFVREWRWRVVVCGGFHRVAPYLGVDLLWEAKGRRSPSRADREAERGVKPRRSLCLPRGAPLLERESNGLPL